MNEFTLHADHSASKLYFILPPSTDAISLTAWRAILARALEHAHEQTRTKKSKPLKASTLFKEIWEGHNTKTQRSYVVIGLEHLPEHKPDARRKFLEDVKKYMIQERHIMPSDRIQVKT